MPEPWDRPPTPEHADAEEEPIFTAVGRAMTAWELLESTLFELVAAFQGRPYDEVVADPLLRNATTFLGRYDYLLSHAAAFFRRNPNQAAEGEVHQVLIVCREYSQRRNDIAHGAVTGIAFDAKTERHEAFLLAPPTYAYKKHSLETFNDNMGLSPIYALNSEQINYFAQIFRELRDQVSSLAKSIPRRQPSSP